MRKERQYNPLVHHRRSIRLLNYDYAEAGLYFITLCCQDKNHFFGQVVADEMELNSYGRIAHQEWLRTEQIRNNCRIHDFIIMPDHMHGIIEILFNAQKQKQETGKFESPSQTVGAIIRGYKIATIKKIKDFIEGRGESEFAPERRGELEFAPERRGELQFAPTPFAPERTGELQFAPTQKIIELNYRIWQRNYFEKIIRNPIAYRRIARYIRNNPKNFKQTPNR